MIERLRVSVWLARQVQLSASGCLCERKLVCGRVQKTCCEGNWNLCIHTGVISIQIWPLKPSACAHEAAPKHSSLLHHCQRYSKPIPKQNQVILTPSSIRWTKEKLTKHVSSAWIGQCNFCISKKRREEHCTESTIFSILNYSQRQHRKLLQLGNVHGSCWIQHSYMAEWGHIHQPDVVIADSSWLNVA